MISTLELSTMIVCGCMEQRQEKQVSTIDRLHKALREVRYNLDLAATVPEYDRLSEAEEAAYDAFRDACEEAYPNGECPHDECPAPWDE
jgi:hypothetical protein